MMLKNLMKFHVNSLAKNVIQRWSRTTPLSFLNYCWHHLWFLIMNLSIKVECLNSKSLIQLEFFLYPTNPRLKYSIQYAPWLILVILVRLLWVVIAKWNECIQHTATVVIFFLKCSHPTPALFFKHLTADQDSPQTCKPTHLQLKHIGPS